MAEELQSLLEKIRTDGIEKAEAQRDKILSSARAEAEEIIKKAEAEAARLLETASAEAESVRVRAENSIRQAARDIVLKLKAELEVRLSRAVSASVKAAMTPEFMGELIRDLAKEFATDPDKKVTILASERDAQMLEEIVRDTLCGSFRQAPQVFGDASVKSGMQISFGENEVFYDFSAEAITELIGDYTGEKLARILEDR